jgi:hypothetical protein
LVFFECPLFPFARIFLSVPESPLVPIYILGRIILHFFECPLIIYFVGVGPVFAPIEIFYFLAKMRITVYIGKRLKKTIFCVYYIL